MYQKCLILSCKILLNLLHNLSLTVLLPWQLTGFQTSPILKAFLATFGVSHHICRWWLMYMIQQAYKYVRLSLWPCLTFFEPKITYILRSSGWILDKDCFIIGGDILKLYLHNRLRHQWPHLHNRKTWIYLEQRDNTKRKTPIAATLKSLLNECIFGTTYF